MPSTRTRLLRGISIALIVMGCQGETTQRPGPSNPVLAASGGTIYTPSDQPSDTNVSGIGSCANVVCPVDHVCNLGNCVNSCTTKSDCVNPGSDCCNGACAPLQYEDANCGSCGTPCRSREFCMAGACHPLALKELCRPDSYTIVRDGEVIDDTASERLGAALVSRCSTEKALTINQASQTDPTVIDASSGRPLVGASSALVFVGGGYFQKGIRYLEDAKATDVTLVTENTNRILLARPLEEPIVVAEQTTLTNHHDYFVLELAKHPPSHTVALLVWGIHAVGTEAAALYMLQRVLADRETRDQGWYVYEWIDTDEDGTASEGDTFALMGSG